MDTWVDDEIWLKDARAKGEEPFNAVRFGLCCVFGCIVAGELLYLLRNTVRYGRHLAFFNFLTAMLSCLIVQYITLAIAMWLAYVPWHGIYPVCITPYIRSCYLCLSGC